MRSSCLAGLLASEDGAPSVAVKVLEEKHCSGQPGIPFRRLSPDTITLQLHVMLRYRNPGSTRMILPRPGNAVLFVSDGRTSNGRVEVRQQVGPRISPIDLQAPGMKLDRPQDGLFGFISPNSEVEWLGEYLGFVVRDPLNTGRPGLLGRDVSLQLELDHAVVPEDLAKELRLNWRQFGRLWTGRVRSAPVPFDIPLSPSISPCAPVYRLD